MTTYIMMAHDDILNSDHEVCRGNSLQELMDIFVKLPKDRELLYWIKRIENE